MLKYFGKSYFWGILQRGTNPPLSLLVRHINNHLRGASCTLIIVGNQVINPQMGLPPKVQLFGKRINLLNILNICILAPTDCQNGLFWQKSPCMIFQYQIITINSYFLSTESELAFITSNF